MYRWPAFAFSLLAVTACGGDSTSPDTDPHAFVGTWQLDIDAATGCWRPFSLLFHVDQDDADRAGVGVMNVVSQWAFDPSASALPLSGNISFGSDSFRLLYFKLDTRHAEFTGSSISTTRLTGRFTDPDEIFDTSFDPGVCDAPAVATKISSS